MKTIKFKKAFTKGLLKGITLEDEITYPDFEGCMNHVEQINKNHKKGSLDYRITEVKTKEKETKFKSLVK